MIENLDWHFHIVYFSTLDGIIFKWTIQDRQSGNIRFIKFRDSSYALDPVLEEIEAKGQQGSKVLLEGTQRPVTDCIPFLLLKTVTILIMDAWILEKSEKGYQMSVQKPSKYGTSESRVKYVVQYVYMLGSFY